jgi:hypothetical protein
MNRRAGLRAVRILVSTSSASIVRGSCRHAGPERVEQQLRAGGGEEVVGRALYADM